MELANTHPKRFAVIAREGWNIKRSDFLRDCIYTFYGMQGAAVGLRVLSRSDVVWRPSGGLRPSMMKGLGAAFSTTSHLCSPAPARLRSGRCRNSARRGAACPRWKMQKQDFRNYKP